MFLQTILMLLILVAICFLFITMYKDFPPSRLSSKLILFGAGAVLTFSLYWSLLPDESWPKFIAGIVGGVFWTFFAPARWQNLQRRIRKDD